MTRTKPVLGAGARLSNYLSASLLAWVYPAAKIGEILDEHGCNSKRIRSLPAVPGTYFCAGCHWANSGQHHCGKEARRLLETSLDDTIAAEAKKREIYIIFG